MTNTETSIRSGLDRAVKAGVKAAFDQGRLLTVAHEELSKATKEHGWENAGTFTDWYSQFGLSQGQVSRLMTMYGNEPLRLRFEHSHVNVPQDQMSLYQLARADEGKLKARFDDDDKLIAGGAKHGVIHRGMSRDEAKKVAVELGAKDGGGGSSDSGNGELPSAKHLAEQLDQTVSTLELMRAERDEQQHRADAAEQAAQELRNQAFTADPVTPAVADSGPSEAIPAMDAAELVKLLLTREDIEEVIRQVQAQLSVPVTV